MVSFLGRRGNLQLIDGDGRRFPGLLVQGDTLVTLLEDLEEEAPGSDALATVAEWVEAYEEMMQENGKDLPYRR